MQRIGTTPESRLLKNLQEFLERNQKKLQTVRKNKDAYSKGAEITHEWVDAVLNTILMDYQVQKDLQ